MDLHVRASSPFGPLTGRLSLGFGRRFWGTLLTPSVGGDTSLRDPPGDSTGMSPGGPGHGAGRPGTADDAGGGARTSSIRTVIVDDVEALRRLVEIALTQTGKFDVVGQAKDGEEAIEVVAETLPELVLLDLSMPRMDGLEALPKIRKAAPQAHVVILTGFEESRLGETARKQGAAGYLEKGLSPQVLELSLLQILEQAGRDAS